MNNSSFFLILIPSIINVQEKSAREINPINDEIKYKFHKNFAGFNYLILDDKLMNIKHIKNKDIVLTIESPENYKIRIIENQWATKTAKTVYEFGFVSKAKTAYKEVIKRNYLVVM